MPQSVTAVAAGLALVGILVNFSIHKIEEGTYFSTLREYITL